MKPQNADVSVAIATDLRAFLQSVWTDGVVRVEGVERVETGRSGFLYALTVDTPGESQRCVLRLPPPGARPVGPADVVRQGRIMAAVHRAGYPAPLIVAQSADPVVLDRPFVLMQAVIGTNVDTAAEDVAARSIGASVVATARQLHAIPVSESGIGDEEPVTPHQELARWTRLMDRVPQELVAGAPRLQRALAAQVPEQRPPTLVHADYHMGNMLFRGAEVVAVLDWEIAEIGQPLIDLACLCTVAVRRQFGTDTVPGGSLDLTVADYLEWYGVGDDEMRWYVALSLYKYAAILSYSMNLHLNGRRHDPRLDTAMMSRTIAGMITDGLSFATGE